MYPEKPLQFEVGQDVRVCSSDKLKDPVKIQNQSYVFFAIPSKIFHGAKVPIVISRWCSANSLFAFLQ